jgi:hypothetical protein
VPQLDAAFSTCSRFTDGLARRDTSVGAVDRAQIHGRRLYSTFDCQSKAVSAESACWAVDSVSCHKVAPPGCSLGVIPALLWASGTMRTSVAATLLPLLLAAVCLQQGSAQQIRNYTAKELYPGQICADDGPGASPADGRSFVACRSRSTHTLWRCDLLGVRLSKAHSRLCALTHHAQHKAARIAWPQQPCP